MRNLARLTAAANRIENGPNTTDRRNAPKCAECGCACELLGNGTYLAHCWKHTTPEEWDAYKRSWELGQYREDQP